MNIGKYNSPDFLYSMEDKSYEFVSDNEDKELSVCFFLKELSLQTQAYLNHENKVYVYDDPVHSSDNV